MSEQNDFEEWYADQDFSGYITPYVTCRESYIAGWQTCAERKDMEIAELEESRLALIKKIDSLSIHETCACSYDKEDDICLHHSPRLVQLYKEIASLREQLTKVRMEAIGWMYSYACNEMDCDSDIRLIEVPKIIEQALIDLREDYG